MIRLLVHSFTGKLGGQHKENQHSATYCPTHFTPDPISMKHVQGALGCIAGTLELGGNIPKTERCSTLELCLSLEDQTS